MLKWLGLLFVTMPCWADSQFGEMVRIEVGYMYQYQQVTFFSKQPLRKQR